MSVESSSEDTTPRGDSRKKPLQFENKDWQAFALTLLSREFASLTREVDNASLTIQHALNSRNQEDLTKKDVEQLRAAIHQLEYFLEEDLVALIKDSEKYERSGDHLPAKRIKELSRPAKE